MRLKNYMAMAAAVAIGLAACTREEINNPADGKTGVTVTAGIEQRAETRITYLEEDDWTKVLWEKTENFSLVGKGLGTKDLKFIKQGEDEGVASATFKYEGKDLANDPYQEIFYGVYAKNQGFNPALEKALFTFSSQNGSGTGEQIMIAEVDNSLNTLGSWNDVKFTFKAKTALMKLTLKNDAFKGKTVSDIKLSATGLISQANYYIYDDEWKDIFYGDITITGTHTGSATDGSIVLYVCQPVGADISTDITITATCAGIPYTGTLSAGKFSEAAVYMAEPKMEVSSKAMTFTIKVPTAGDTFIMPFIGNLTAGVTLTIHWGENGDPSTIIGDGGEVTATSPAYATAGLKKIIIISTADVDNQQMPRLQFYQSGVKDWLISMDTPMLNMGTTDLSSTFHGCTNLTSIATGLFDKNKATNFRDCFNNCIKLASVPPLLFAPHKDADNFDGCFSLCKNLVLNPNIFCDESKGEGTTRFLDNAVDFKFCFFAVGFDLPDKTGGIAPSLWTYDFGSEQPITVNCFQNCDKVTNAGDIDAAWNKFLP